MADLYIQQAEADELLYFLAVDYEKLLLVVDDALAERRAALKVILFSGSSLMPLMTHVPPSFSNTSLKSIQFFV